MAALLALPLNTCILTCRWTQPWNWTGIPGPLDSCVTPPHGHDPEQPETCRWKQIWRTVTPRNQHEFSRTGAQRRLTSGTSGWYADGWGRRHAPPACPSRRSARSGCIAPPLRGVGGIQTDPQQSSDIRQPVDALATGIPALRLAKPRGEDLNPAGLRTGAGNLVEGPAWPRHAPTASMGWAGSWPMA